MTLATISLLAQLAVQLDYQGVVRVNSAECLPVLCPMDFYQQWWLIIFNIEVNKSHDAAQHTSFILFWSANCRNCAPCILGSNVTCKEISSLTLSSLWGT